MKIDIQNEDIFGANAIIKDVCFDCGKKLKGKRSWVSAILMRCGRLLSISRCPTCFKVESKKPMEKAK